MTRAVYVLAMLLGAAGAGVGIAGMLGPPWSAEVGWVVPLGGLAVAVDPLTGLFVALVGATPGQGGTRLSQAAWLPVLRTLGARLYSAKQIYVAGAGQVFDADGKLVDEKLGTRIEEFLAGFAAFVGGS